MKSERREEQIPRNRLKEVGTFQEYDKQACVSLTETNKTIGNTKRQVGRKKERKKLQQEIHDSNKKQTKFCHDVEDLRVIESKKGKFIECWCQKRFLVGDTGIVIL